MAIRAIFLDLGDTLYDSSSPVEKATEKVCGLIVEKYQVDKIQLKEAYTKLYPETNVNAFSEGKSRDLRKERFRQLLKNFEVADESLVEELEKVYAQTFESELKLYADVLEGLTKLEGKYELYLLTEGPEDGQRRIAEILGIEQFFKEIFVSGAVQKEKRNGELFEYALKRTGRSTEETVVVGDSYERDVLGSRKAGLRSILVDRAGEKNTCKYSVTDISDLSEVDAAIQSLSLGAKFLRKRNQRIVKPLLILGHPRSGTNFASHTLRDHPEVGVSIEPFSMHCRFMVDNECRLWTAADYHPASIHNLLNPNSETTKYFQDFRRWLYSQTGELRVLKETLFFLQMEWLREYLPDVRVLYLERDPLGIAASFKQGNFFERWNYGRRFEVLKAEVERRAELEPYRDLVLTDNYEIWAEKLAVIWLVRISEARRFLPAFDHIAVTYEEMATNPHDIFERIIQFSGLELDLNVKNGIDQRRGDHKGGHYSTFRDATKSLNNWKTVLTEDEKLAIRRISRKVRKLGDVNGIRLARTYTH